MTRKIKEHKEKEKEKEEQQQNRGIKYRKLKEMNYADEYEEV